MEYAGKQVEEVLDTESHRGVEMVEVQLENGATGWVYQQDVEGYDG